MEHFIKTHANTLVAVGIGVLLMVIGISVLWIARNRNKSYENYIKGRDMRHEGK